MDLHLTTAVVLGLVVSVVIPGVSSLLARPHWPSEIVAALTMLLAAINGFVVQWQSSPDLDHYNWSKAALTALASYIVAYVGRAQFFRGTATDAKLLQFPVIQPATADTKEG